MTVTLTETTYAAVDQLKPLVGIKADNTDSDVMLARILNAAAIEFDRKTRQPVEGYEAFSESASEIRYFDDAVYGEPARFVRIDDLLTCTLVKRDGVTISANDYKLWPYNRGNGPYTRLLWSASSVSGGGSTFYGSPFRGVGAGTIAITGTWGYCDRAHRPQEIENAVLQLAALMYKTQAVDIKDILQSLMTTDNVGLVMARSVTDAIKSYKRPVEVA